MERPTRGASGRARPLDHDVQGLHVLARRRRRAAHGRDDRTPDPTRPGGARRAAVRDHQHRRCREEPDRRARERPQGARGVHQRPLNDACLHWRALPVSFRPPPRADFALLAKWLALPHVAPWWSDEPTVTALEASYGPSVDGTDPTEGFIVELEGRPVGFIQRYRLDDYPPWAQALGIEHGAGIDYLL